MGKGERNRRRSSVERRFDRGGKGDVVGTKPKGCGLEEGEEEEKIWRERGVADPPRASNKPTTTTMKRDVCVAATQFRCHGGVSKECQRINVERAKGMVEKAARRGAQVVLLQELFASVYFPQTQHPDLFQLAHPVDGHPFLHEFAQLAKQLQVVLPISFFEKDGQAHFNSVVVFDADGTNLGLYRKSHIPDGPGYQEKFYFNPGDTGFKVFDTKVGKIGIGICWDQWFPETARAMVLQGAEMLLYPTAIGSEPTDPAYDSSKHWQRVMQGHAAANMVPVIASNRIGLETVENTFRTVGYDGEIRFYGKSFIAGPDGAVVKELGDEDEAVITATFDLAEMANLRVGWGLFRDRRPDLYKPLLRL